MISGQTVSLQLTSERYGEHVAEAGMLRMSLLARAKETSGMYVIQEMYRFRTPDLNMKVS